MRKKEEVNRDTLNFITMQWDDLIVHSAKQFSCRVQYTAVYTTLQLSCWMQCSVPNTTVQCGSVSDKLAALRQSL